MPFHNILAAVAVRDMAVASEWYTHLFDRGPDRMPMAEASEWQLAPTGGVQLVLQPRRAGQSMATLGVDDLDPWLARIARLALPVTRRIDGAPYRVVTVRDPDGNEITFAQANLTDPTDSA